MPFGLGFLAVAGAGSSVSQDYELISSQILSTNTATITFSSIPQTYKHLQIRYIARNSNTSSEFTFRFNNISVANYATHRLRGNGTNVFSTASASNSSISFDFATPVNSSAANLFAGGIIDILDYTSSSKNPVLRSLYGIVDNAVGSAVQLRSGIYPSAQAITSVSFDAGGFNFVTNSRFSLYGIRG